MNNMFKKRLSQYNTGLKKYIFPSIIFFLLISPFLNPFFKTANAQVSAQESIEAGINEQELYADEEDLITIPESSIDSTKSSKKDVPRTLEYQSSIEKMFNTWTETPIRQFGYDFFDGVVSKGLLPVGDEYTVGPGDTIAIYFWGDPVDILGLKGFYTLSIDRDGKIFVPNLGVFYVWGLNLSQTKDIIYNSMAKKFKQFEIEVTLGKLREFPVYVSGYVKKPGIIQATGVYNVMDVLSEAGGVERNGSLRNIILKRIKKNEIEEIEINLYDLLIQGNPINIKVKEGDSIFVNPIGKTAGISGVIKRPAIYELSEGNSINDLIELAGGILPSAYSIGIKLIRYEADTLNIYEGNLEDRRFLVKKLNDGDLILIEPLFDIIANEINVKGHIAYPGKYSFKSGLKLSDIIDKIGILPDTNVALAQIKREETDKIINFSPEEILSGKSDLLLEKRDTITFYPERVNTPVQIAGEVENPILIPFYTGMSLLDALDSVKFKENVKDLKAEVFNEKNSEYRAVYLYELMIRAYKKENIPLSPGDKILIKKIEPKEKNAKITVLGEVKYPGVYEYSANTYLYDVLTEAGGYTEEAYPYGLIYIKESAKMLQMEQIEFVFTTLEEYLLKTEDNASYASEISQAEKDLFTLTLLRHKQLLENMKKRSEFNLGRISLDIPESLDDLKNSPDNIAIDEGDYIYVPKKPNHVLVLGDVFNQISMPYKEDYSVRQYIKEVGGFTQNSDKKELYIIKANGKVISKRQKSYRGFYNMKLNRGDTIVIPSKIKVPVMWRLVLRDTTQILFQGLSTVALVMTL